MKRLFVAFACLILVAACKEEAKQQADDKKGDQKAAVSQPADDCATGAIRNTEGGFCVSVPAEFKESAPFNRDSSSRSFGYHDGTGNRSLTVVVITKEEDVERWWNFEIRSRTSESQGAGKKDQQSMDLPNGGKFWSWVDEAGTVWGTGIMQKDKRIIFCRTRDKSAGTLVEACKSIRSL